MIPAIIANQCSLQDVTIHLGTLVKPTNTALIVANVTHIDPIRQLVFFSDNRPPMHYDVCSIDVGAAPIVPIDVELEQWNITPVKPFELLLQTWQIILDNAKQSSGTIRLVVVGGGAAGFELAMSMKYRLQKELGERQGIVDVILVSKSNTVLPSFNQTAQSIARAALERYGIRLFSGYYAKRVTRKGTQKVLVLEKNGEAENLEYDECIWCTQVSSHAWISNTGLDLDAGGFIKVSETLQSSNYKNVFAVGDAASIIGHPRPKAGVFAVRQGPILAHNIMQFLYGKKLKNYTPQKSFLSLISYGRTDSCLAVKGSFAIETRWAWVLKNWIDVRWMSMFDFQKMMKEKKNQTPKSQSSFQSEIASTIKSAEMRCGGCGSKVGSDILSACMKKLLKRVRDRDFVVRGIKQKDDVAVIHFNDCDSYSQLFTVDFIKAFVSDPFLFGKICANHAMSDIFAKCGAPKTALAIPLIPFGSNSYMEETLTQLMAGAIEVLEEEGCALVGGHSSEGHELSLGLFIQGDVPKDHYLSKGGLAVGDVLILTKPLGIGVIFAADMRYMASSHSIECAIESALKSNRSAALCLREYGSQCCTDVTGFGLIGHLIEMIDSGSDRVSAVLNLNQIPLLPGSVELSASGIQSSLFTSNFSASCAVDFSDGNDFMYKILYDPQTSGGLLASVPENCAEDVISKLHNLGYGQASVIGSVKQRNQSDSKIRIISS
jgi:selenide,water dikinase